MDLPMGYKKELKKNRYKNIFDPEDDSFFGHQAIEGAYPHGFTWTFYYIGYYCDTIW
mgnify:CR=1 FL=1